MKCRTCRGGGEPRKPDAEAKRAVTERPVTQGPRLGRARSRWSARRGRGGGRAAGGGEDRGVVLTDADFLTFGGEGQVIDMF